jgi:hypothetical protein
LVVSDGLFFVLGFIELLKVKRKRGEEKRKRKNGKDKTSVKRERNYVAVVAIRSRVWPCGPWGLIAAARLAELF